MIHINKCQLLVINMKSYNKYNFSNKNKIIFYCTDISRDILLFLSLQCALEIMHYIYIYTHIFSNKKILESY